MVRKEVILSWLIIVVCCFCSTSAISQNQSILDFTVKELNGDTIELRDRLDPNANYIIEAMAFWCPPCVRSIEKFNYHQNYWKERFNVDILLIEDEHWDDLPYVEGKMNEYGWDLDIVVSNDQYASVGITGIPRYFFKSAASDTVERVYGNIEKFLIERMDSIKFSPILKGNYKQALLKGDCENLAISKYDVSNDTTVNDVKYQLIHNIPIRESDQNGNILRYNEDLEKEEIHIKYSAALCSRIWLKDLEGDSMQIKILDRYQEDLILHVVTDQILENECSEEEIPFEFVQNIGTNAGLDFDIEDGKIVSRLICHENDEELIYMDNELGNMCLSLSAHPIEVNELNIHVYPNPFNSTLFLDLDFEGKKIVEVYDSKGQLLISKSINDVVAEVYLPNDLKSTLYFVKLKTKYGVITKKVFRIED